MCAFCKNQSLGVENWWAGQIFRAYFQCCLICSNPVPSFSSRPGLHLTHLSQSHLFTVGQAEVVYPQTTWCLWFRWEEDATMRSDRKVRRWQTVFQKHQEKGTLADMCQGKTGLGSFTCPTANHRESQKNGYFWTFLIRSKSYGVGLNVSSLALVVWFAWLPFVPLTFSSQLLVNK